MTTRWGLAILIAMCTAGLLVGAVFSATGGHAVAAGLRGWWALLPLAVGAVAFCARMRNRAPFQTEFAQPRPRRWLSACLLLVFRTTVRYREQTLRELKTAPSIVVCNHVSLLDGVLVALASPRPLCFAVETQYAVRHRATRWGLRMLSRLGYGWVIPMDRTSPAGLRHLARALRTQNRSVMLFPEGQISPTGAPLPEQRGLEWLRKRTGARVVRLELNGPEDSRLFAKNGRRLRPPILLNF